MSAFAPINGGSASTVSLAATSTTGRVALSGVGTGQSQIEIQNKGGNWAFVVFGDSSVVATAPNGATAGGYPVGPGMCKVVTIGTNATNAAAICASGETATLWFSVGCGDS